MPMSTGGGTAPNPDRAKALALGDSISNVYGSTATLLTRPPGATVLVLKAQVGSWNIRTGDRTSAGMPTTAAPAGAVSGTQAWPLAVGETLVISAPYTLTVKGYAASDSLTYMWL